MSTSSFLCKAAEVATRGTKSTSPPSSGMAAATARCQDRISDIVDAGAGSHAVGSDFSWRKFADAVAALDRKARSPVM